MADPIQRRAAHLKRCSPTSAPACTRSRARPSPPPGRDPHSERRRTIRSAPCPTPCEGWIGQEVWCRVQGEQLVVVGRGSSGLEEIFRHDCPRREPRILDEHYPEYPPGNGPRSAPYARKTMPNVPSWRSATAPSDGCGKRAGPGWPASAPRWQRPSSWRLSWARRRWTGPRHGSSRRPLRGRRSRLCRGPPGTA